MCIKALRLVPSPSKSEAYILPETTASALPGSSVTLSQAAPCFLSLQLSREPGAGQLPGTGQRGTLGSSLNDHHLQEPVQTRPSGITHKT